MLKQSLCFLLFWAVFASAQSCPTFNTPPGRDFHGQTLTHPNFSGQDLSNANFSGATLIAPFFGHANLTNANFGNAVITNDPANPSLVADFSFANLQHACFAAAQFRVPTYFTYATLTCSDFSNTDLTTGNMIFGDDPLKLDKNQTDCKMKFHSSTMSCEFLKDWQNIDLSGAHVAACGKQFRGQNFSGTVMTDVDLRGLDLSGANFSKANLSRAKFNSAGLANTDFSGATLFGAAFDQANLTGAVFYGAFLSNNTGGNITEASTFIQAHLKNVNLSAAQLSGVKFTNANFYGDTLNGTCKTANDDYTGPTQGCAAAHGAIMTETSFQGAYLYGVDFTDAKATGVTFDNAVLIGSNFSGANLVNGANGNATSFYQAYLQGVNLSAADVTGISLRQAVVDFTRNGNNLYVLLNGADHNQFACTPPCAPPQWQDVCVEVNYPAATIPPAKEETITCPDGNTGPCGPQIPTNKRWQGLDPGNPPSGVPQAWYDANSTYTPAPTNRSTICNGRGQVPSLIVLFW